MRRVVLVLILLAVLLPMCQQKPSAEDIMKKVDDTYKNIKSMRGIAYFYIKSENKTVNGTVKFEIVRPDKFRVEGYKFVTGSNGSVIWVYDKTNNTVKKYEYRGHRPEVDYGQFIERMIGNFSFELIGTENLNGIDCYVIVAKPLSDELKQANMTITMYIDTKRFVPLKFETRLKNIVSIMEYKKIDLNVPIDQSEFEPPT